MMTKKFRTSLYAAPLSDQIPMRVEVRNALWDSFKKVASKNQIQIIEAENRQLLCFDGTYVDFRVMDSPSGSMYLLSFIPTGIDTRDVRSWSKLKNEDAAMKLLSFCDLLGSKISIHVSKTELIFERVCFLPEDYIDISEWEVEYPYQHPPRKESLRNFILETGSKHYENIYQCVPNDNHFYLFTDSYIDDPVVATLKSVFRDYGDIQGPRPLGIAKEFGEKFHKKRGSIFIFLENEPLLKQWYSTLKIFFDGKKIPTQYVKDTTIRDKMKYPGVKANLLLEVATKTDRPPVVLQAPEEIFTNDGFLCLSDLHTSDKKLFGALFTYSRQGLDVDEEVQIYQDINFDTPTRHSIEMLESDIELLSQKISTLIGRRLKIDILLTKAWKQDNIRKLIKALENNKIRTNRVYYLSSKTCRFVDDYVESCRKSFNHPYVILGKNTGFLKTATDVRFYPHLFSYYIELVWPEDGKLTQGDFEKILWLVKKRLYRIQEFYVLKRPEPLCIFSNMGKMQLGDFKENLIIPLKLLL